MVGLIQNSMAQWHRAAFKPPGSVKEQQAKGLKRKCRIGFCVPNAEVKGPRCATVAVAVANGQ